MYRTPSRVRPTRLACVRKPRIAPAAGATESAHGAEEQIREQQETETKRRRRGILAGAALVVAALATRTAQPVGASQLVGTNGGASASDTNADGVQGYANDGNSAGVFGRNNAFNGVGVMGVAPSGIGVSGASTNGPGISGTSMNGMGVVGICGADYQGGVSGQTWNALAVAVGGANWAGGWAGYFTGGVYISGGLVVGSGYKSAAVPLPDGTHRLVYCVESPESWFEDVGQANLLSGKATIALDTDFAATVLTSNYHVFLTPYGDCKGLCVTAKGATGFVVQEVQGGSSSLVFSWRVMAKRKDIAGERLAKVDLPRAMTPAQPPSGLATSVATRSTTPTASPVPPASPPALPVGPTPTATSATSTSAATATAASTATRTSTAAPSASTATGTGTPTGTGVVPNSVATPRT